MQQEAPPLPVCGRELMRSVGRRLRGAGQIGLLPRAASLSGRCRAASLSLCGDAHADPSEGFCSAGVQMEARGTDLIWWGTEVSWELLN